jgi:hypothetical protein
MYLERVPRATNADCSLIMMSQLQTRKIVYRATVLLFCLMGTALFLVLAIFNPRRPLIYKIADRYRGWAVVRYDDPSCAPIEHETVFMVITIPSSGLGCTSNPLQKGWRITLYEYANGGKARRRIPQSGWGGGGEIWAGFDMPYRHSESFFVGTEDELKKSWSRRPQ